MSRASYIRWCLLACLAAAPACGPVSPDPSLVPLVMTALGDSITAASSIVVEVPADLTPHDDSKQGVKFPGFSWATGDNVPFVWKTSAGFAYKVKGHEAHLANLVNRVIALNLASRGKTWADAPGQATEAAGYRPDYATVMFGSNDICQGDTALDPADVTGTIVPEVRWNARKTLRTLLAGNPAMKIILVPVPDLTVLREAGLTTQATAIDTVRPIESCQARWDYASICTPLLDSSRTDAERAVVADARNQVNAVLESVAGLDEFRKNVKYIKGVETAVFNAVDISRIDCFHPSPDGQNKLSDITWQEGWFDK